MSAPTVRGAATAQHDADQYFVAIARETSRAALTQINSLDDEFYAERFFSAGRFWNRMPK